MISQDFTTPNLDAGLLCSLRRVLHEGIAHNGREFSYAQLLAYAQRLGEQHASEFSEGIDPVSAGSAGDWPGVKHAGISKVRAARA